MDLIIEKAFIQALQDTLGVTPERIENKLLKGYLSNASLTFEDGKQMTVTFVSSEQFLGELGAGLLGEDSLEDSELRDLSQELVNLTIGLAKRVAPEKNLSFSFSIPCALGIGEFDETQCCCINFVINGAGCSLFLKEAYAS